MENSVVKIVSLNSFKFEDLRDFITMSIIELGKDMGRVISPDMIDHTAHKFAHHVVAKYGHWDVKEINMMFNQIATNEFGKVFEISFNSLCSFLALYNENRMKIKSTKVEHKKYYPISTNEFRGGFAKAIEKDPSLIKSCPEMYKLLILGDNNAFKSKRK